MNIKFSDMIFLIKLTIIGGVFCELILLLLSREWSYLVFGMVFLGCWIGWAMREIGDDIRRYIARKEAKD